MNARGFTLVELLVATLLVLLIAGALFTSVAPVRDFARRSLEGAHLEVGARAALDHVTADIREAGSDAAVRPLDSASPNLIQALELFDAIDSMLPAQPATALRVRRIPHLAAQARLSTASMAGDTILRFATASSCCSGAPSCGFRAGDSALLFSDSSAVTVFITAAGNEFVMLSAPIPNAFPAGAVLTKVVTVMYGVRPLGDGSFRLMKVFESGAEQPLLDDVVEFEATADAANVSLARRVSLRLRVQAASADLRGPAGNLFKVAGTQQRPARWLPDTELRVEVALRNPRGVW